MLITLFHNHVSPHTHSSVCFLFSMMEHNSKSHSFPPTGSGYSGGFPGRRSSRGPRLDPRGEVPDEPRRAALLQQRGHGLHSLPAAG